jgi:ribonuclease HI
LDGGWREVKTEGGTVKIATRAAIDHEGHVLGGRICEEDVNEDNYIAELTAQLDALTDATGRGTEERVIMVFDATSPVRAMLRFGRLGARARGDRLAAELLEHFERLRRRVAALVLLWQTSHVGEPVNEWVDVMCDKFGVDDDYPIPRGTVEFASMTFPNHRGPAQAYAMSGMCRVVAQRLRGRVRDTSSTISFCSYIKDCEVGRRRPVPQGRSLNSRVYGTESSAGLQRLGKPSCFGRERLVPFVSRVRERTAADVGGSR